MTVFHVLRSFVVAKMAFSRQVSIFDHFSHPTSFLDLTHTKKIHPIGTFLNGT